MGADRFIPVRNEKQMEMASFLLSKNARPTEDGASAALLASDFQNFYTLQNIHAWV